VGFYGAGSLGIDLTTKLISYLADPGNSRQIVIGSAAFFTTFCGGNDPAPGTPKGSSGNKRAIWRIGVR
jgi:hypothetical protein